MLGFSKFWVVELSILKILKIPKTRILTRTKNAELEKISSFLFKN
jgi:hypothetical protein